MIYVAVVDIGKTNAKLAIVDSDKGQEVDVRTTPNRVIQSGAYPHFDVTSIWKFLLNSLKEFSGLYAISSISVTTHGACIVLLDAKGELATPILDYEYNGPDQLTEQYNRIRPDFSKTGSPRLSGGLNAGAQLHWLFQQDETLADKVKTVLMYPQFWSYRLCGGIANEPTSLGCHTDLWCAYESEFSELTDALDIRQKMAPVKLPSSKLGTVLPDVAKVTGLAPDTPVYCGIHDSNASLYAHINEFEGAFSVVSTGTWVVCMSPGSDAKQLDESRDILLNVSGLGNPVPSSRFMGGREYDYLFEQYSAEKTDQIPDSVIKKNAFILPSVETGSGPFQNRHYEWTIDPKSLSPQERYCVISFYLALMTGVCLELISAAGPTVLEGPFTQNEIYCAMLGAATGQDVVSTDGKSTGTSIGAALLATANAPSSHKISYSSLIQDIPDKLGSYRDAWLGKVV